MSIYETMKEAPKKLNVIKSNQDLKEVIDHLDTEDDQNESVHQGFLEDNIMILDQHESNEHLNSMNIASLDEGYAFLGGLGEIKSASFNVSRENSENVKIEMSQASKISNEYDNIGTFRPTV